MRAAVLREFSRGIEIEEVAVPDPKPNQVLVRILASGICQTDLHTMTGVWDKKPVLPIILGHEGAGVIEALGSKVEGFSLGQKVLIPWLGRTCRQCACCKSGAENYCEKQLNTGYVIPGTHAEFTAADSRSIAFLPNDLDPIQAAPLACAGLTAFEAIKQLKNAGKNSLLILGAGGLGHLAIQYALPIYARVAVIDQSKNRVEEAKVMGAEAYTVFEWEQLQENFGFDAALVFVPDIGAVHNAIRSLKNSGTLVVVGLGATRDLIVPWFELVARGICIKGSYVGPIATLKEVIQIHQKLKAKVLVETRPLNDIQIALADLAAGRNQCPRMVLVP